MDSTLEERTGFSEFIVLSIPLGTAVDGYGQIPIKRGATGFERRGDRASVR